MRRVFGSVLVAFIITVYSVHLSWGVDITHVTITEDQSVADIFSRYTVDGIRTTLPQPPEVPGFIGASYIEVYDLNGDGINEIICTSGMGLDGNYMTFDGAVALYISNGSNANDWERKIIRSDFAFPNEVYIRDMDGDSDPDIMVMDNFLSGWVTCGVAGIYYLENPGDITTNDPWDKHIIYQGEIEAGETCPCFGATCADGIESYHRVEFLDIDGVNGEDFVTTKIDMWRWQNTTEQYMWVEWFKKETDLITYPSGYSGPHEIGEGAGFLFNMIDINDDGLLDVVAPQFFIHDPGGLVVKGSPDGSDPKGDSLIWFENPGQAAMLADPDLQWTYQTIDNWYKSPNPMGQGMEAIAADIDNDTIDELVFSNHNHQEHKPLDPPGNRIWPSGVYLLEMSDDPSWTPVSIETGDPGLSYDTGYAAQSVPYLDPAVLGDAYAVDRPGGPYTQGSPGMVRAGAINSADSLTDLVVPGDGKGTLYYYQGEGVAGQTLSFKRASLYVDPACMPGEAEIADIDGDGKRDIVAAIYDTSVFKTSDSGSVFIFSEDNCPTVANPGQEDTDADGVGDVCDNCPTDSNPGQENTDGDGAGDVCDTDDDDDGTIDTEDVCPYDPYDDDDSDTYCGDLDNCPDESNPDQNDSYPPGGGNNCGDVCECEGDFDHDGDVKDGDIPAFKASMGRGPLYKPCSICKGGTNHNIFCQTDADCPDGECRPDPGNPCYGDFDCDGDVKDGDIGVFKADMGRGNLYRPCPPCSGVFCTY